MSNLNFAQIKTSVSIFEVDKLSNLGYLDSAYALLIEHEEALLKSNPDQTKYLFTKLGWDIYASNPSLNARERILAIDYGLLLIDSNDSFYRDEANDLMHKLLSSLYEDMSVVVEDFTSSMNRQKLYLSDFCNELIPKIPLIAEYGMLHQADQVFDYGVIFNAEADELLLITEKETNDSILFKAEEKAAILYVSAFRLMSSACAIEAACCHMDGSKLSAEQQTTDTKAIYSGGIRVR